ncbi:MAG TPA: DUF2254 family protein, partial [Terriglobales bacterium]|nr:DUF2254 family protein [Terriglobales bacterium]
MTWNQLYRLQSYLRSSLWVVPFFAIPIALGATRLLRSADALLGWTFLDLAAPGAQATLQTIVSATLSFVVFTFGSLLVAIQVASAQLTPRIIATTLLRNDVVRFTVGLFIFTLLFALSAQNRIEAAVPQLVIFVAALLGTASFAAFFYLIDYASRLLRPVSILTHVANDGLKVITTVYADPSRDSDIAEIQRDKLGQAVRVIRHEGTSQIVLAV